MRLARPSLILLVALLVGPALAGCASSATAGWTFAPPPSATPTPVASAGGSEAPTASGSAAPGSAAPGSAAPGSPAASGGAADVSIMASNIAFAPTSVTAPAGRPFTIDFNNMDASVPHDIYIKDSTGADKFEGAIINGPADTTYNVPALAAGTYTFVCSIHSNMTGTMVVQ